MPWPKNSQIVYTWENPKDLKWEKYTNRHSADNNICKEEIAKMHCLNIQDPVANEKYSRAIEDKIPVMKWTPVWIAKEFGTSIELGALSLINSIWAENI